MKDMARSIVRPALVAAAASLLAACASGDSFELPKLASLNPFAKAEEKLPGKRIAVLTETDQLAGRMETASAPVALPEAITNSDWSAAGGTPANAPGHLAFGGGLKTSWSSSAGTGSSSRGKLTASPIVHQGRVYVLDAVGAVSAFNASGGGRAWTTSLAPEHENAGEGQGGGITAEGDRIFAGTGFGTAVAIDASSGAKLWEKKLGAPVRTSPTVADGRVYVVNTEGQVYCLSGADGSILWRYLGVPQQAAGLLNNSSPAVQGGTVVVPFSSGDVVALNVETGQPVWTDSLSQARSGSSLASLSDPASPVIDGGVVFAVSHSGRLIATDEKTGERLWSLNVSSAKQPAVAGDALYVADTTGRLIAVTRATGEVRWATKLPGDSRIWNGPVLAGGRLWLTSGAGKIVGVDAATGKVGLDRDLGEAMYISPIIAGGRMYVLTDKASLVALN